MCGILGLVSDNIDEIVFSKSLELMKHRGPDNSSIMSMDNVIFGHNRLSIIDLDARSNQPFTKENLTIIYNGEIFNFLEIKQELIKLGKKFTTSSDTEVLLTAYKFWGESFVNRLNGMWAFAIYDRLRGKIFLSRDRYGIKPLYYSFYNNQFIFGSEIKAILHFTETNFVSKKEIIRYLVYGAQEHREDTLFSDIKRFPKASIGYFDLRKNKLTLSKFYHIKTDFSKNKERGFFSQKIKTILEKSVGYRLISDVQIGMALSGGLDSNVIVYLANKQNELLKSFTATYGDSYNQNENVLTNKTVKKLKLNHSYKHVDINDYVEKLNDIIWYHDEPFDTMGIFAQYAVYEKMKEDGIKVSLDGQGADEIFAGYSNYRVSIIKSNIFNINFLKEYVRSYRGQILKDFKILIASLFPLVFERLYFFKRSRKIFTKRQSFIPSLRKMFFYPKDLNKKLKYDIDEYLSVLLKYVDRNSMANSIEGRCPFLDYNLVDISMITPPELKYKNGFSKYVLRDVFREKIDSEVLWNKEKKGFPVPYEEWIKTPPIEKKIGKYFDKSSLIKELGINVNINKEDPSYWRITNLVIWENCFKVELNPDK